MDIVERVLHPRRREHLRTVELLEALLECDRTRAHLEHKYASPWTFLVGANGRRCEATHHLQIDHIVPFALGGSHAPDNPRVLCGAHNGRRAELTFGTRSTR